MLVASAQDQPLDGELVEAIASSDAGALAKLYDRHSPRVMGLCLRILGDRADAEETLEDVFWQVWREAGRFDAAKGDPLSWLVTIARSRAIDRLRSGGRRKELTGSGGSDAEDRLAGLAAPVEQASPLAAAETDERRRRIEAGLAALDPSQRRAVEMSFYLGYSHSEIADALGEPLGTVKTRIRTGLLRLRDALRPHYQEGAGA